MPESDLALLLRAAEQAAEVALRYWKRTPRVWEKPGGAGPVTEADLAVNDALEAVLRAARPGYGWLSEESDDGTARLDSPATFIIDPIDGTRAFVAGEDSFAISVAVAEAGQVTAGVVVLPALRRTYSAATGAGAWRNGERIVAAATADPARADILTTRPNLDPAHWPGGLPAFRRSFRPSLAYRLCLVAEGRHDGMITFRDAWEWDIAAGSLIAAQAGARVTDGAGQVLRFNRPHPQSPGVLAAPGALHAALMERIRPGAGQSPSLA